MPTAARTAELYEVEDSLDSENFIGTQRCVAIYSNSIGPNNVFRRNTVYRLRGTVISNASSILIVIGRF